MNGQLSQTTKSICCRHQVFTFYVLRGPILIIHFVSYIRLKRLSKFLTRLGRLTVYHSFILSNFNYCPLTWHFCSEANTKKMERIQERALRFIYDDHNTSYEDLLMKSKLPSLKLRRIRTIALESFKIINKDCPVIL